MKTNSVNHNNQVSFGIRPDKFTKNLLTTLFKDKNSYINAYQLEKLQDFLKLASDKVILTSSLEIIPAKTRGEKFVDWIQSKIKMLPDGKKWEELSLALHIKRQKDIKSPIATLKKNQIAIYNIVDQLESYKRRLHIEETNIEEILNNRITSEINKGKNQDKLLNILKKILDGQKIEIKD